GCGGWPAGRRVQAGLLLLGGLLASPRILRADRRPLRVTFVNPGRADEALWRMIELSMQQAAPQLGIALTVAQAGRNRQLMRSEALAALAATPPPDLLLIGNEERSAREVILAAEARGVPCFLLLNDLDAADAEAMGAPRERVRAYLGSLVPDNLAAGRDLAEALLAAARARAGSGTGTNAPAGPGARRRLLAIVGDRVTPSSTLREEGLHQAIAAAGDAEVARVLPGHWSEREAEAAAGRYLAWARAGGVGTDLVWAANDPMAIGALRAFAAAGETPGETVLFGGVNWTTAALDLIAEGRMEVSFGGHLFAGVLALAVLRDWADGRDFATEGGGRLRLPLAPARRDRAAALRRMLEAGPWDRIDAAALTRAARGPDAPALPPLDLLLQRLMPTAAAGR
ncbi:ABC transporter substrate-binding protein, partial [Paracraurococcus ruber]